MKLRIREVVQTPLRAVRVSWYPRGVWVYVDMDIDKGKMTPRQARALASALVEAADELDNVRRERRAA